MQKALLLVFFLYILSGLRAQSDLSFQVCTQFWPNNAPITADSIDVGLYTSGTPFALFSGTETSCVTSIVATDDFPEDVTVSMLGLKDSDDLNGVTILDLAVIYTFILGLQPFSSPYAMIAADVNRSGNINGVDIIEIRRLLTGIYSEFPNSPSWRFFYGNCTFPNPANPFGGMICEPITIHESLEFQDTILSLVGLKVGDVDGDANPASSFTGPPIVDSTLVEIPNILLPAGLPTTIEIRLSGTHDLNGVQLEFVYDTSVLEFNGAEGTTSVPQNNFGIFPGKITALGIDIDPSATTDPGDLLMKLQFTSNAEVYLWDVFSLNADIHHSLGLLMDSQFHPHAIKFNVTDGAPSGLTSPASERWLKGAYPNPFVERTAFYLQLEEQETVRLEIFDASGKRCYFSENLLSAGTNLLQVPEGAIAAGAVGYYRVQAGNEWTSGKLVRF